MKFRPCIVDDGVRAEIQRVKQYADENRLDRATIERLIADQQIVGELYPGGCLVIPVGFRVVFSIEEQPAGWSCHISISVDEPGAWPNPFAVQMIADEFGMSLAHSHIDYEQDTQAINLIQPLGIEDQGLVA